MQVRSFSLTPTVVANRRVKFVANTAAVDSYGTIIVPRGCRLDRFKAAGSLPLLWAHKRDGEPEDVLGRVVEVEVTDEEVMCTAEFEPHAKATQVLNMIQRGIIRGCSIGFSAMNPGKPRPDGVIVVDEWELVELSVVPVGANPDAMAIRSFRLHVPAPSTKTRRGVTPMTDLLQKLGLAEGAKPDEIAAALIKYIAESKDADGDKQATVLALLSALTPAPSASSASDGASAAAMEAAEDEIKKLRSELDAKNKAAEPSAEEQAERAIKAGRWPDGKRAILVAGIKNGKQPVLFGEGTFSARGIAYTAGGNPIKQPAVESSSRSKVASLIADADTRLRH
jgi:HK97 family phage prohead protease